MLENAVLKIRNEVDQNNNNAYIQAIGGFLLQHLDENPEAAEKILAEDKTIAKSLDAMKKVAERKKTGNFVVLTPEEGFKAVLDYYGIKAVIAALETPKIVSANNQTPAVVKEIEFDIKLEDLL